jgi:hypothetical protein
MVPEAVARVYTSGVEDEGGNHRAPAGSGASVLSNEEGRNSVVSDFFRSCCPDLGACTLSHMHHASLFP